MASQWDKILDGNIIESWHAHVYFDAKTRDDAWKLRELVSKYIGDKVQIGTFWEKPVGPHPMWSYQLLFFPQNFREVVQWLVLNHGSLDVLLHPNTDDELRDHEKSASFIGHSHELKLDIFKEYIPGLRSGGGPTVE